MAQPVRRKRAKSVDEGTQLFSLRLPKPLYEELRVYAFASGRTMNDLLRDVIEQHWLKNKERPRILGLAKTIEQRMASSRKERP